MKKAIKRLPAVVLGVALGFALIGPVKAQMWASGVCNSWIDTIYLVMQDRDWTRDRVVEVQGTQETCKSANVSGLFFAPTGEYYVLVNMNGEAYLLQFDLFGKLLKLLA